MRRVQNKNISNLKLNNENGGKKTSTTATTTDISHINLNRERYWEYEKEWIE